MKKISFFTALLAIAGIVTTARAADVLKVVVNDDQGGVISEAEVPFDGSLKFDRSAVLLRDAYDIPVSQFDYSDVFMISFEYVRDASVGSLRAESILQLRQNPVVDNLEIVGFNGTSAPLKIFDAKGATRMMVKEWKGEALDVSSLSPGIYFVTVNKMPLKFIKK